MTNLEEQKQTPNEVLNKLLGYALDMGKEKIEDNEDVVPFTILVVKENIYVETHPGMDVEECFQSAKEIIENAQGASMYVLGYEGYVEEEEGMHDAVIAEGGIAGEEIGKAVAALFTEGQEKVEFEKQYESLGEADNMMEALHQPTDEEAEILEQKLNSKYEAE